MKAGDSAKANRPISQPTSQSRTGYKRLYLSGRRKQKIFQSYQFDLGWLESPRSQAVTSTITLLELLVQPYRLSDIDRVNKFYALLSTFPHLDWIAPTLRIADMGAHLRAEYNLRTPDATQAATALSCGATGFVSNDGGFRRVTGLDVIVLDDLLQ